MRRGRLTNARHDDGWVVGNLRVMGIKELKKDAQSVRVEVSLRVRGTGYCCECWGDESVREIYPKLDGTPSTKRRSNWG